MKFNLDKYLFKQKLLTISEKYTVIDEKGDPLFFIHRPAKLLKGCLAIFASVTLGFISLFAVGAIAFALGGNDFSVIGFGILLAPITFFAVFLVTLYALIPRRHIFVYEDKDYTKLLLAISQDKKFEFPFSNFTLYDESKQTLAIFRKNWLRDIIRKRWYVYDKDRKIILAEAWEDSIIKSILRRLLGPLFGILRTNFIIERYGKKLGEFNRKFTILDRYVLDLTEDKNRELDRRIAIALGVLLDTAERR